MDVEEYLRMEYPGIESIKILLSKIKQAENTGEYFESGNVFDLRINFKENSVYIEENLYIEVTEFLNLTLDEFYLEIFNRIP